MTKKDVKLLDDFGKWILARAESTWAETKDEKGYTFHDEYPFKVGVLHSMLESLPYNFERFKNELESSNTLFD